VGRGFIDIYPDRNIREQVSGFSELPTMRSQRGQIEGVCPGAPIDNKSTDQTSAPKVEQLPKS
jgi:hypothetical protein